MVIGEYKLIHILKDEPNINVVKIFSKQYWEEVTSQIVSELKKIGIILFDCYLVGSGMNKKLLDDIDDIDSIIILTGYYSDKELLHIRNVIDNLILNIDIFRKYHFRLFDEVDFIKFSNYDGYRLFEFQCNSLSFYDTNILYDFKPVLNSDNFNISYLIQLVYDCLMNKDIFLNSGIENKKATHRLKRNIEINHINEIEINLTNILLNDFYKLRNNPSQSINGWQMFLSKYFIRVKHEFINKSNRYQHNLKEYLCR